MSNFDDMMTAISQLKYYGNVSSVDDFFLKAVSMENNTGQADQTTGTVKETQPDANILKFLTNIMDGGLFTSEIFSKTEELVGAAPSAGTSGETEREVSEGDEARFNETVKELANSFYFIASSKINGNATNAGFCSTKISMDDVLGDMAGTSGADGDASAPSKTKPCITAVQVLPAMLNFGQRDTGAIEVFMNMIPPLEWTKAVPYVDIQVITPGPGLTGDTEKKLAGISQLRFLNGVSIVKDGTADMIMASAKTAEAAAISTTSTEDEEEAQEQFTSAGMELFTSPQTLVPSWEIYHNYEEIAAMEDAASQRIDGEPYPGAQGSPRAAPIIDRMRPFMTFNSMKIKVVPTRGMMSHKSAEFSLTLHDRSRLPEIGSLVSPSSFGKTELLVEWGWSHPDSPGNNGNNRNPFGLFINSLRTKEKFGVYNAKYNFTDDGQVQINLTAVTRGANQVNISDIGMSPAATSKLEAFERLIEAISELRKTVLAGIPQMRDVIGMSTISNLSPTNAGALFNGDKAEEINAFIDAQRGAEGDVGALQAALEEAKESTSEIQTTIAGVITAKMEIAASVGDPWLKARHAEKADATPKIPKLDSKDDQNWCSFGRIASLFIAAPLLESKKFDEIQMIFYTFNDKSSHMYNQNIACFPIDLNGNTGLPKLFEAWQKEKIQVSVSSFMGFVNQYYLSNMAAKGYGFSNIFTRDEDGKAVISLKDDEINELQSKKDAVLKDAYGAEADLVFKLPRIRMIPEAVPHIKPAAPGDEFKETETILRLHFFDDAACKYTGLHDILSSQRNSEMGVVRQQAVAASAIEGAEDSHWEKIATDIKNAMPEGFLQETAAGSGYYYVAGGSPALKHFIKSNMPSITYGTENSALKNISMSSMHNSSDTTIHMIRAQRAGNSDSATPGEQDRGLPIRIMPMQASGESIGCPILNHGQQFFIDMGTGTTADNVYAVCGLDHTLEPGNFMTKFKLIPIDAYGKYESMLDSVDKALAICAASPPPPPPTNE